MAKTDLDRANKDKLDEFYTLYPDIETELSRHSNIFKDKVVYCNCDGERSNFVKYFTDNFEKLGLKDFIATSYNDSGKGKLIQYNKPVQELPCNGSFDSFMLIQYIMKADIVVTNPPFSLIREYIKHLNRYKKKFILVAPHHILGYKEMKDSIVKGGLKILSAPNSFVFEIPNHYTNFQDSKRMFVRDGQQYINMGNIFWITNLELEADLNPVIPSVAYSADKYERYINKDAINVDNIADIPKDYYGLMGVPISYMRRHNAELFEIVDFRKGDDGRDLRTPTNDSLYTRVLIRRRNNG